MRPAASAIRWSVLSSCGGGRGERRGGTRPRSDAEVMRMMMMVAARGRDGRGAPQQPGAQQPRKTAYTQRGNARPAPRGRHRTRVQRFLFPGEQLICHMRTMNTLRDLRLVRESHDIGDWALPLVFLIACCRRGEARVEGELQRPERRIQKKYFPGTVCSGLYYWYGTAMAVFYSRATHTKTKLSVCAVRTCDRTSVESQCAVARQAGAGLRRVS